MCLANKRCNLCQLHMRKKKTNSSEVSMNDVSFRKNLITRTRQWTLPSAIRIQSQLPQILFKTRFNTIIPPKKNRDSSFGIVIMLRTGVQDDSRQTGSTTTQTLGSFPRLLGDRAVKPTTDLTVYC
jgi:hypothetical protein